MNKIAFTFYAKCLVLLFIALTNTPSVKAQGQWTDDFTNNIFYNWSSETTGASVSLSGGKMRVNMALQTNSTYRGDIIKNQSITYYPGNYPIVAVKMSKPPKCNLFFDTPMGAYNNSNNNHGILYTSDGGKIYFWNLATGTLGTTKLSTTSGTTLSWIKFKIADAELTAAQKSAGTTYYDVSWVGTFASEAALRASVTLNYTPIAFSFPSGSFSHPGILHNSADLGRIKNFVNTQFGLPYQSYLKLVASPRASSSYTMQGPFALWTRTGANKTKIEDDCKAAYFNAHMWNITGNTAYRDKALQILNAYASTSTGTDGAGDAQLNGLAGFLFVNAAEIMRYTNSGWSATNIAQCETMLKNVFYPVMQDFKPRAHGAWDAICMETLMAVAIFTNDIPMFNKVGNYALNGEGNGSLRWYFLSSGQAEESNRDQAHTQLALGALNNVAEMAYKQGMEILYTSFSKAIKTGFEYTAKYNNGNSVSYTTHYDYCEVNLNDYTPEAISATERGVYRPIYEMAFNHYVVRKNGTMPYSLTAKQNLGPEGESMYADHPGFGTLFFYSGTNAATTSAVKTENALDMISSSSGAQVYYASGNLKVQGWKASTQIQVALIDLSGRVIQRFASSTNDTGEATYALNKPADGIYIVKVVDGEKSLNIKLAIY